MDIFLLLVPVMLPIISMMMWCYHREGGAAADHHGLVQQH